MTAPGKPGRPRSLAPKDRVVPVRMSANGIKALDQARAGVPRSTFLRRLLKEHIEKGQS